MIVTGMKSRSQIAVEQLDEIARSMERKWGVGRLPRLVPIDLAEKYWRQFKLLNAAITEEATGGSVANVEYQAGRMCKAWTALDKAAEAAGAAPLAPGYLDARFPDGRLLVICGDPVDAHRLAGDDRMATVWSLAEIATVLWNFELVNDAKRLWPGAQVEPARVDPDTMKPPVDWSKGDPLPFDLQVLAAG